MPMIMPFEEAWEKLVREKVDTSADLVTLTKKDIETVTGNELRLMAKVDFFENLPKALQKHGYFILPVKNGEYVLVRGNGYHILEKLKEPPAIFRPQLDFDLETLDIGNSETQHLDYSYQIGLIEHFAGTQGLRQTIRNRKRMPAIEFHVGKVGPIRVSPGVQIEVDSGCEGRNDVILIEAKTGDPKDFIIRQLFYPYRKWHLEIPRKRIRPWFFCSTEIAGRRLYKFWEYTFADDNQYQSLKLKQGATFLVEPDRKRLTVEDLLRTHVVGKARPEFWNVPQADAFWRVAEIPLLIAQGIDTSAKVAAHYKFDPRQSSYYRQAAEYLGMVRLDKNRYVLTDLGREYTNFPTDERRRLLAGILALFPPMRATLETLERAGEREVGKNEIAALVEQHSKIRASTPRRRASTLLSWLHWLQSNTGVVQMGRTGFSLR